MTLNQYTLSDVGSTNRSSNFEIFSPKEYTEWIKRYPRYRSFLHDNIDVTLEVTSGHSGKWKPQAIVFSYLFLKHWYDLELWCKEYCVGRFILVKGTFLYFENYDDVVLFKLTWM